MPFDYKKEYPEFYLPKKKPSLITIPKMSFVAVRGRGDPNDESGEYQRALSLLYGVSFTIKMSPRAGHSIDGWFEYSLPPLEGFWWMEGAAGVDYSRKADFNWISAIRLPEFVTREVFEWAAAEAQRKKKTDFSDAQFIEYEEGLCVQCMHIGPYDDEPATVALMHSFAEENGCAPDITDERRHHEIYLSDARRCAPEKLRTVLRHPVKKL